MTWHHTGITCLSK